MKINITKIWNSIKSFLCHPIFKYVCKLLGYGVLLNIITRCIIAVFYYDDIPYYMYFIISLFWSGVITYRLYKKEQRESLSDKDKQ